MEGVCGWGDLVLVTRDCFFLSSPSVKDGRSAGTGVLKCVSPIFGGDTPTRECAWMVKSMIKITPLLGKSHKISFA